MNFKKFINSFKMGDSSWEEDPILCERIKVAQILINEQKYPKRSLKAPEYLTDFGLRKDESPKILINYWESILGFDLPKLCEMEKELETIDIQEVPYYIDAIILVLGDYSFVHNSFLKRYSEALKKIKSSLSLLKLATLCGALGDVERANNLFMKAKNVDPEDNKTISHRISVLQLKRNHNIENFYNEIDKVINNILAHSRSQDIEIIGLIDNLVALELIMVPNNKKENIILSKLLLENAQIAIDGLLNSKKLEDESELVRYSSQIAINQVQLELESEDYGSAKKIIQKDMILVENHNREYISEVYATYAYILYCEKSYKSSIKYAIKAIKEQGLVGNVLGVQESQKLLISNLYKLDKASQSREVYKIMKRDLLGRENYDKYIIRS